MNQSLYNFCKNFTNNLYVLCTNRKSNSRNWGLNKRMFSYNPLLRLEEHYLPDDIKKSMASDLSYIQSTFENLVKDECFLSNPNVPVYLQKIQSLMSTMLNSKYLLPVVYEDIILAGKYKPADYDDRLKIYATNPHLLGLLYEVSELIKISLAKAENINEAWLVGEMAALYLYGIISCIPFFYKSRYDSRFYYIEDYDEEEGCFIANCEHLHNKATFDPSFMTSLYKKIVYNNQSSSIVKKIAIISENWSAFKTHDLENRLQDFVPKEYQLDFIYNWYDITPEKLNTIIEHHDKVFIIDDVFLYNTVDMVCTDENGNEWTREVIERKQYDNLNKHLFMHELYQNFLYQHFMQIGRRRKTVNREFTKCIHQLSEKHPDKEIYVYYTDVEFNYESEPHFSRAKEEYLNCKKFCIIKFGPDNDDEKFNTQINNHFITNMDSLFQGNVNILKQYLKQDCILDICYEDVVHKKVLPITITTTTPLDIEQQEKVRIVLESLFRFKNSTFAPMAYAFNSMLLNRLINQATSYNDLMFVHILLTNVEIERFEFSFIVQPNISFNTSKEEWYGFANKQKRWNLISCLDTLYTPFGKRSKPNMHTKEVNTCMKEFKTACEQLGYTDSCIYERVS